MLQIKVIVENINKTLNNTNQINNSKAQELIMHSFIAGVCFERTFGKTNKEFQNILNVISSLKLLIDAKIYDLEELVLVYNKVAIENDDVFVHSNQIEELYEAAQSLKDTQQETQLFYNGRSQQKQNNQQTKNSHISNNNQKSKSEQKQCTICLENSPSHEMKTLKCKNIFHSECLNRYFQAQIQAKEWPFLCPDCKNPINQLDIQEVVGVEKMQIISQLSFDQYVKQHSDELSCCPTNGCQYVFIANGQSYFKCPNCQKAYCLNCKADNHQNQTCQQYQLTQKAQKEKQLDDQFLTFARGAKYKQCPKCKIWVEKNQGCNHMTCRCKFQFCYYCGGVYKKCGCKKRNQ